MTDAVFLHDEYIVRRKLLSFLGQKFYIYDRSENLIGFVKQKAFKLKEDIRVFRTEECREEVLVISARQIIDFSAAYDVVDATTNEKVGALRRRGMKSIIRDTWEFLDKADQPFAVCEEDSTLLGLVRRFLTNLIPQGFTVTVDGLKVADFQQNWNIFVPKLQVTFHGKPDEIDRRLGLAAAVLMSAIEGRQQ